MKNPLKTAIGWTAAIAGVSYLFAPTVLAIALWNPAYLLLWFLSYHVLWTASWIMDWAGLYDELEEISSEVLTSNQIGSNIDYISNHRGNRDDHRYFHPYDRN